MKKVLILFPHQLNINYANEVDTVILVEEYLFFRQYKFHKQKILFHRASMRAIADELGGLGKSIHYIESIELSRRGEWIHKLNEILNSKTKLSIYFVDTVDDYLNQDINNYIKQSIHNCEVGETKLFLTSNQENEEFFKNKKRILMADYYAWQRKRMNILMDDAGPIGGKYSYDEDNRKKFPRSYIQPEEYTRANNVYIGEAKDYVNKYYKNNPGNIDKFNYAITRDEAHNRLYEFLKKRLNGFGTYEDAMSAIHRHGNHSELSMYINVELIDIRYVVKRVLKKYHNRELELNDIEGYIRQIIGWREFIRAMYIIYGRSMRKGNYFGHKAHLPGGFWDNKSENTIIDSTLKNVNDYAYAHHIERLMVLGNYMLLSEYNPHQVYEWFMMMFIDAYDWVMVPNVYDMSQYASGGVFATKPYICASNYIVKMSDYKRDGIWDKEIDDKFWNFLYKHREVFANNPRFKMLLNRIK